VEIGGRSGDWLPPDDSKRSMISLYACMAWGILFGSLTFAVGLISWGSDNPVLSAMQAAAFVFIFPGLVGSALIVRNVHDFPLALAALINAVANFGIAWAATGLFLRSRQRKTSTQ
jgi:hypothetical protein